MVPRHLSVLYWQHLRRSYNVGRCLETLDAQHCASGVPLPIHFSWLVFQRISVCQKSLFWCFLYISQWFYASREPSFLVVLDKELQCGRGERHDTFRCFHQREDWGSDYGAKVNCHLLLNAINHHCAL